MRPALAHPLPRLAAVTHFFIAHGLPLLFVVVMLESFGLPLPGETALIAFGVLAAQGHYSIVWVIVIAAAGAIVGDNLGYWLLGRLGGRALFRRWGWLRRYSDRILPRAERIMRRHGGKTVFFGRFVAVLRVGAAAVAGLAHMPWWKFLFWNASGGIVWATRRRAHRVLRREGARRTRSGATGSTRRGYSSSRSSSACSCFAV